jgi:DNA repair protein RecO (recombination protein O)
MFQKTDGFVLNHTRYGESSAIINIFTRELGIKSYIVNGIFGKKKKDKFILLQPLSMLDLEVYNRQNKNIQRIKDFRLKRTHEQIPFSQSRRAQAFFLTEILSHILRNENTNHELFDFISDAIMFLDSNNEGIENFHILFLFELTAFMGFLPDGKHADLLPYFDLIEGCFANNNTKHPFFLSADETKLFSRLFAIKRETLAELAKNVQERKMLLKSIVSLYERHFPGTLKINSIDVLETLF